MERHRIAITVLIVAAALAAFCCDSAFCQDHIRKLDAVRTSMTNVGSSLPDLIRKAQPGDIRTLERLFEINNYALVTIESYLKMIKIALATGQGLNKDVLPVLNGWLKFISHYCEYDIKYIDEALRETKDTAIIGILKSEKDNIASLRDTTQSGISENTQISAKQ